MKNINKRITYESKFDRKYACSMVNHGGISKVKKQNRKTTRRKLKEDLSKEMEQLNEDNIFRH